MNLNRRRKTNLSKNEKSKKRWEAIMKLKTVALMASILLTFSALAYGDYLTVKADKSQVEIIGDGYEEGIEITYKFTASDTDTVPEVAIPEKYNYADCELQEITRKNAVKNGNEFVLTYKVTVGTSVVADSGGCMVILKGQKTAETSLVTYNYVTNY